MLRHQPVPAPVLLRAPGRAHRDRAQINGQILGRQRRHDRHTATSRTEWPAPTSAHDARQADKKLALPYAITAGNTGTTFAINSGSGQLTVADPTLLDYEATTPPPNFALTVRVTDPDGLFDEATVTVDVNDVVEVPNTAPSIDLGQSFSVDENSANGTDVGTVLANDPENDSLTYAIRNNFLSGLKVRDEGARTC